MTVHHMKCKCKLAEHSLLVQYTRDGRIRRRLCPIHREPVDFRVTICDTCGNTVKQGKSSILSKYCPECRLEHFRNIRKVREGR
jgi:hypothetical protein